MTVDRRVLRAIPIAVVLAVVVVALVLISLAHWRRGAFTLGVAMGVAGTLRWVLSERSAGVLAVRGRRFDVLFYYGCGLGLALLTVASLPVPE